MGGEGLDILSQDYPPVLVCFHGNRAVADKLLPWQHIRMLFIPHLYSGDPEKATIELLHKKYILWFWFAYTHPLGGNLSQ